MTRYAAPPSHAVVVPFELFHDPMRRLLIVDFAGDPDYDGIELQVFDDEVKGRGLAVLMYRTDGKLDWYMTPGLTLDRGAAAVGAGIGEWHVQDFRHRLDIGDHGVDAEVRFTLHDGRELELVLTEHRRGRGRSIDLLAPLGVGIERPTFLPVFTMFGIDLVRRRGTHVSLRIGGAERTLERIPVPIPYSGRFSYLARYSDDPLIVRVNPARDGLARLVDPPATGTGTETLTFAHDGEHAELAGLAMRAGGHETWLTLRPALPDLLALRDGFALDGRFDIGVDGLSLIGGAYGLKRSGGDVALTMQPTEPWRPAGGPLVWLTLRMFPSFFRTWPMTYRWTATVHGTGQPRLDSHWERVGS